MRMKIMGKLFILGTWFMSYLLAYILPNGINWPLYAIAWTLTVLIVVTLMNAAIEWLFKDIGFKR